MTHSLHTWGWVGWDELRAIAEPFHLVWADLDGWHDGEVLPESPAATTHVWGWMDNAMLRVRVDGDRALPTLLQPSGADSPALPPSLDQRDVEVSDQDILLWDNADPIPPTSRRHLRGEWKAKVIAGASPLTFISRSDL